MDTFTFYALRHKESSLFMPQFEHNRGYSYWSPVKGQPSTIGVDGALAGSIRLFATLQGARNARTQWARGIHERQAGRVDSYFGPDDYDRVVPKDVGRKADDLEIVPMVLSPVGHMALLKKYVAHVIDSEGYSYIGDEDTGHSDVQFTPNETAALEGIREDIRRQNQAQADEAERKL